MSLSRVIKKEEISDSSVSSVDYKSLAGAVYKGGAPHQAKTGQSAFTPLFPGESPGGSGRFTSQKLQGSGSEGISSATDMPDGMIYIAEDELQKQLEDARLIGAEEGRQAAEKGLAHVFRALRSGADSLVTLRDKVLRESEADLLKLSRLVARKIILQEVRQDPEILANIIASTVRCCSEQDRITIRLTPEDYKTVMANRQKFEGAADETGRVVLAPDESIKLGGCLVETPTGTVDARIESQLDEVYTRCMEERGIPQELLIKGDDGEES